MGSFSDRRFWMLEGFGYANSEELKAIHTSFNGSVTIDRTTIPGRSCVNISSGGYIDLVIPRYDVYPWSDTTMNSGYMQVAQAKVYLDAATYTNLLTNSFLMELWSGNDQRHGFGIGANTSTNQDNWYIKSYDVSTDLSVMTAAYIPPAIPQRTLVDLKFIFYSDGSDDGLVQIYANNFLVTHTAYNAVDYGNHGSGRRFRGIRLHGLANQSGPTLWSDLMVYTIPNDYRHSARSIVDHVGNTGSPFTTTLWGNVFVPMTARVYDITPETTSGGITQFSTLGGGGNAITALSTLDTNSYVTSTAASQAFRLKVGLPDQATGDNSTAVTVTDQSEVLGFQYRIYGKDVAGTSSNFFLTMGDETLSTYRYRYYKIRGSEIERDDADGGYMSRIIFLNSSLTRLEYPVGATCRLNNVGEVVAPDFSPTRVNNTTLHTQLLASGGDQYNIHTYYVNWDLTGVRSSATRAIETDYIIDMGSGNVGPDWYAIRISQLGSWDRLFQNWSIYGSSDGITWYALGDTMATRGINNVAIDVINRRHPDYLNGKFRNLSGNFQLNAAQFEQIALPYTGDPLCGGNLTKEPRTPPTWAQFKNYTIGFNEV